MRVGVVVNPHAWRVKKTALVAEVQAVCQKARRVFCTVWVTQNQQDLDRALEQARDLDLLVPCGGDGTLTATLSAAHRVLGHALPRCLPLAGGTMNTVARNLGHTGHPAAHLAQCLSLLERGVELPHRLQGTLLARTEGEVPFGGPTTPKTCRERLGFLASAAMGARFLAAYTTSPRRGLVAASMLGARTVASCLWPGGGSFARWLFSPLPAKLTVDGQTLPQPSYRLFLASTIADVGLFMKVPWQAGHNPQRFQVIASSLSLWENAIQMPRMLTGQPLVGQPHFDSLARHARLELARPEPIVLDGELFCAETVEFSVGPVLRVVAPQGIEPRTLRV